MLDWKQSPSARHSYHAVVVDSDPASIGAALVETWHKFLDGLDAVPPDCWSIALAYLVTETGDVTLYPTTRENPMEGMEQLSVMLTIRDWATRYAKFADADRESPGNEDPDAAYEGNFERVYRALLKMMATSLKDAMTESALARRFAALKKRPGFAIYYVDQGELVHTANLVYLWGQRPPKAFPAATPLALFTGLMHKAQIYPPDCLKVENDQVIEAIFFGHEFTDKYVEILESVPDVAGLCKNLRVLHLKSTRIKPAGVERLKALLPTTDVRVQ